MFRIDIGWCKLMSKNCFCLCSCMHGLEIADASWNHAYIALFLHSQLCSWGFAYVGVGLRTRGSVCIRGLWPAYVRCLAKALLCPFSLFFIYFTSMCNPNTPFCHFYTRISLYASFYLHSYIKTSFFLNYAWIRNLMSFSFLAVIIPLYW